MFKFSNLWQKSIEIAETPKSIAMTTFWLKTNEIFKIFLNNCSWFVYVAAGLLILFCIFYYIYDCKRRLDFRRRRENFQRANERIPQRRRPGAIYRDHEIFRNAIKTVQQYIGPNEKQGSQGKSYVLKKTRSGLIYGSFSDNEEN
ncbi:uncharacterized protein ACRADG_001966 [Cochliomyia hominivorax]